jgi:FAD:protein FMN transferase
MMAQKFRAMNSNIISLGLDGDQQVWLKELFEQFERTASRFIPNNSLSYVNQSPIGVPVHLESTIADLLEKSLQLSRKVNYYVNPFRGKSIKSIGYTDSFQNNYQPSFEEAEEETFVEEPINQLAHQWIIKKRPFSFDFGGFGKGYIVDQAIQQLTKEQVSNALVNAGGDLSVIGRQQVGIENPLAAGKDVMRFYMKDVSLATSGKSFRKWSNSGEKVHHILNGRTGQVANNEILQASVIANTTMEAETITKLFCILPFEAAKAFVTKTFPGIAYFVYFENQTIAVGGNSSLYEELEVAQ